jgi:hypothetical protein
MMNKLICFMGFLCSLLLLSSCQDKKAEDSHNDNIQMFEKPMPKEKVVQKETNKAATKKSKYLCKVNGKPWYYSSSSGLINSMFGKDGVVVLTFKFEDHRDKTVQLRYDYKTMKLRSVLFSPIETRHGKKPEFQLTKIDNSSLDGRVVLTKEGVGEKLGYQGTAAGNGSFTASLRDKSIIYEVTDINFEGVKYLNSFDFDFAGRPKVK